MFTANRRSLGSACPLYAALMLALMWAGGAVAPHQFNHFSGVTVANGRIYLGTYDGTLYCFGVDAAGPASK